MPEEIVKMLGFLSPGNKLHRILRRGIVGGLWFAVAIIVKDQELLSFIPLVWEPIATAALGGLLVMAEKALREYQNR